MSTIPGYSLEQYVAWNYSVVVEGLGECNISQGIAELLGIRSKPRPRLSQEQFKKIVGHWEPYRDEIERKLDQYDDTDEGDGHTVSWRDYAGYSFEFVPNEVWKAGNEELRMLLKETEFGGAVGGGKTGTVAGLTDEDDNSGISHDHEPGYN